MDMSKLREEALRRIGEHLDRLPENDLRALATGEKVITLLRVDQRLGQQGSIESAYAYLNSLKTGPDVKATLAAPVPVGNAKGVWIDHVLLTLFGQTYVPPTPVVQPAPARKPPAEKAVKSAKPVWDAALVAKVLSGMTSVPEGEVYLETFKPNVKTHLKELAGLLEVKFSGKNRPELVKDILWMAIGGPGALERAKTGS